jgi:hypothetical protein
MPFYLSPLVKVIEKDLSLFVPAVSTSIGSVAADLQWGPIGEVLLVSSTEELELNHGIPTDRNYKDWFTIWNFLNYADACRVSRVANIAGNGIVVSAWEDATDKPSGYNIGDIVVPTDTEESPFRFRVKSVTTTAPYVSGSSEPTWPTAYLDTVVDGDVTWENIGPYNGRPTNAADTDNNADLEAFKVVKNSVDWEVLAGTVGTGSSATFLAKYPGKFGNRISVAYRDGKTYTATTWASSAVKAKDAVVIPTSTPLATKPYRYIALTAGTTSGSEPTWPTTFGATVVDGGVTWKNVGPSTVTWDTWTYKGLFPFKPATSTGVSDEFAVVVLLDGVVVETFIVDAVAGRVDSNNNPNYAGNALNRMSKYVWFNDERKLNGFVTGTTNLYSVNYGDKVDFAYGLDGDQPTADDYIEALTVFEDAESVDINFCMQGGATGTVGKYIVETLGEGRKDIVAFVSPHESDVVRNINPLAAITSRRTGSGNDNLNVSSSYGFMDGNYKYQFDRWNDKYRWVPLNGDMAGLAAATDNIADPWWSFGGYNRGLIKNCVKLAWNPTLAQRNDLYQMSVNPVIMSRGEGPVLLGDRTMLIKPSAFRAVNVRRLFIVCEKAIATAAKYMLFEFNDEITQNLFVSLVTPFLRDVQGRRGIQEDRPGKRGFLVVADNRINTDEVKDRQEFKASIFIRPNRSINFIELTFVATKSGAVFEELIPQVTSDNSF